MKRWPVVVADDHEMIRTGLRTVLEQQCACEVVGEAATGTAALALVHTFRPALLVTDMVMPELGGLEVLRQVRATAPATQVIVFSMHADVSYVREALHAGALGYVLKESLSSDLIAAIQHALAGRRYVSPVLSEQILDAYAQPPSQAQFDPYQQLSEREQAVFVLTAQGRTSSAIAAHLGLSSRTVESHRANLMRKIGLHTLADLVRYAIRRGLITLDD